CRISFLSLSRFSWHSSSVSKALQPKRNSCFFCLTSTAFPARGLPSLSRKCRTAFPFLCANLSIISSPYFSIMIISDRVFCYFQYSISLYFLLLVFCSFSMFFCVLFLLYPLIFCIHTKNFLLSKDFSVFFQQFLLY